MTSVLRLSGNDREHLLIAHINAFPVASQASFDIRSTYLERDNLLLSGATLDLYRQLEDELRLRARGASIERLRQMVAATWFGDSAERVDRIPLHAFLSSVAACYLRVEGDSVMLQPDRHRSQHARRWRWMSLMLPSDVLIAAQAAGGEGEPVGDRVQVASRHVLSVLEHGVAATHLHAGGAFGFPALWASLMGSVGERLLDFEDLDAPGVGPVPFRSSERLAETLGAAAVMRLALAAFLEHRSSQSLCFDSFFSRYCARLACRFGTDAIPSARIFEGLARARDVLEVGPSGDSRSGALIRYVYRALTKRRRNRPRSYDDVLRMDPIADWLPPLPQVATSEVRFLTRLFRELRLMEAKEADQDFARLVWQYVRVRCIVFRFLTEELGTSGLDWFIRHYRRISPMRTHLGGCLYEAALQLEATDVELVAFEPRFSMEAGRGNVFRSAREIARQTRCFELQRRQAGRAPTEVGAIVHFLKEAYDPRRRKLAADPSGAGLARFAGWVRKQIAIARSIAAAITARPELMLVYRGLDVAAAELDVPLWPTLSFLADLRAASRRAAAQLRLRQPLWQVRPFGLTYHAGEDFRRLPEGLRRMHELLEFGVLEHGDRIGHGLALGIDPERWSSRHEVVFQPREERLDDILWELERYAAGDIRVDASRVESLRAEATRIGHEVFGSPHGRVPNPELLREARRLRHDVATLARWGYPRLVAHPTVEENSAADLCYRYLTDGGVFLRGTEPILVPSSSAEIEALREIQAWLRALLSSLEITIESNPSSNLVIADLDAIDHHPAFRLHPLPTVATAAPPPVLLSLNDDDPMTFSTCLADEYAYVYEALLRLGVATPDALEWVDRVRATGVRSRFTLPASKVLQNLEFATRRLGE